MTEVRRPDSEVKKVSPIVLILDDEEAMRDSCAQVLKRDGIEVLTAPDGQTAMAIVAERPPDAAIVDLKLPGMSGEEFLYRARELDPNMVAVVITGYPTLSSALGAMKAGAYDFLPKPFDAEELRIITRRALERRRLALAAASAEQEKKRMRDLFVAMVSHQLKSPAASLKECLDAAIVSCPGCMPAQSTDLLRRAASKAHLLLDLMDDWLTLARAESGALTASRVPLDLCAVVERAIAAAQGGIDHNKVAVRMDCQVEHLQIHGDPEALQALFVNLVDNAMKYTPDGGKAVIRVGLEGDCALVSVEDTGPGIAADDLGLLFEPFFRSEAAKKKHGTGLGLAIVKQIAQAHGGRVEVTTAPGQGAAFRVLLPLRGSNKPIAHPARTKSERRRVPAMQASSYVQTGNGTVGAVLVVGGGVAGMQASLDLAEAGYKVYLVEKGPAIGGAMAQLDKTFPTNDCAMCTLAPRLVDCGRHPNVEKLTYSEVLALEGQPGHFRVRVKKRARSVDPNKCTGCGECSTNCLVRNRPYFEAPEPEPLDLLPDQLAQVDRIIGEHGSKPSSIVPVLQDINAEHRWLPPGAVRRVSQAVGLPLARVLRIASFYNMFSFKPRGKHLIRVCMGTACHVKGGGRILERLARKLQIQVGATTADMRFSLEAVRCLGCCGLAPVVTVNDDVFGKMTGGEILRVLDKYPL